jgi:hypothetical protein
MKIRRLFMVPLFFAAFLASALLAYAQPEQITLTTYYPAPFGAYQDVHVFGQLKMETVASGPESGPSYTGGGIWFFPPASNVGSPPPVPVGGPAEISGFNDGAIHGIRVVYHSTGAANEEAWFGNFVGPNFVGLRARADGNNLFSVDVTVNHDLTVIHDLIAMHDIRILSGGVLHTCGVRVNIDSTFTWDPLNGVGGYAFPQGRFRNMNDV